MRHNPKFYFGTFLILTLLSFLILKPFMLAIVGGIIIGYIFYPAYARLVKSFRRETLSAIIMSLIVLLVFTVPVVTLSSILAKDAYVNYLLVKQELTGENFDMNCDAQSPYCSVSQQAISVLSQPKVKIFITDSLSKITTFMIEMSGDIIRSLPKLAVDFVILIFVLFYTFRDGKRFIKKMDILPLKIKHRKMLIKRLGEITHSTIYGQLMVAAIQGLVAGIGYWIFGLKSPLLLGLATAIVALIPIVGTALIWLPAGLYLILGGAISSNDVLVIKGIGLLVYSLLVISSIDNIIRPRIIGGRAKLHPLLILIGIFGGVALLGPIGLFLGPIILGFFVAFTDVYREEWSVS